MTLDELLEKADYLPEFDEQTQYVLRNVIRQVWYQAREQDKPLLTEIGVLLASLNQDEALPAFLIDRMLQRITERLQ